MGNYDDDMMMDSDIDADSDVMGTVSLVNALL